MWYNELSSTSGDEIRLTYGDSIYTRYRELYARISIAFPAAASPFRELCEEMIQVATSREDELPEEMKGLLAQWRRRYAEIEDQELEAEFLVPVNRK